jgi:hypothetical protein
VAANEVIGGSGHLEASIHVQDPPTKVALTVQCGKPDGSVSVTEVWDSPSLLLHSGAFRFDGRSSLSRLTLSATNAILKHSPYNRWPTSTGSSPHSGSSLARCTSGVRRATGRATARAASQARPRSHPPPKERAWPTAKVAPPTSTRPGDIVSLAKESVFPRVCFTRRDGARARRPNPTDHG